MSPVIEYMFSAGYRCNSPETLNKFKLRPFSGPFDYLFIDIETTFKLIHGRMELFLKDIIVYNKRKQQKHNIKAIDDLNEKNMCYMVHDYNNTTLQINTNFLDDDLSNDLYKWNKICIFLHHELHIKEQYDAIVRRVNRFNSIIEQHSDKTCLFYITKILTIPDIEEYMNNMIQLKHQYSINSYITIIVCCDNLDNACYFKDNILFIIKKVPPYNIQIESGLKTDNNLDYSYEIYIMNQHFNFKLVPLTEL